MQYKIRLNKRAFNPVTGKVIASRLWEIEQCSFIGGSGRLDSEKVIWHCADVRIDGMPIRDFFTLPKEGDPPWEIERFGICVRGQDNAVEILTTPQDVSN